MTKLIIALRNLASVSKKDGNSVVPFTTFLNEAQTGVEDNNEVPVGCIQGHVFLREWRCNVCECIMDTEHCPICFVRLFSTPYNEHDSKDKALRNYNQPICGKSIQSNEPPTQLL